MRSATFVLAAALVAALFAETTALTHGKKKGEKAKKTSTEQEEASLKLANDTNDTNRVSDNTTGKAAFKIVSMEASDSMFVPTRTGCSCSNSYGVGEGDCDDGDVIYAGCMATPCDGDTATDPDGTEWPSWCHTEETECPGNGGANWDYCDPATSATDRTESSSDPVPGPAPVSSKGGSKSGSKSGSSSDSSSARLAEYRNADGSEVNCPDGQEVHVSKSGKVKCKTPKARKDKAPLNAPRAATQDGSASTAASTDKTSATIGVMCSIVFAVGAVGLIKRRQRASVGYNVITAPPAGTIK